MAVEGLEVKGMDALAYDEKIPSHVFRFVERELYDYPVNRDKVVDYLQRRQAVLGASRQAPENDGRKEEGNPSDPTHDASIRLLALERSAERAQFYVNAIDAVMNVLNEEQRRLVKRKYFDDDVTNEALAAELNMGKERYYRMREEVVRKFALRFGVI